MNRRAFIRAGLVLAAAPLIVRASSLMPVRSPALGADLEAFIANRLAEKMRLIDGALGGYFVPWEHASAVLDKVAPLFIQRRA